jgi:hypothetical protein
MTDDHTHRGDDVHSVEAAETDNRADTELLQWLRTDLNAAAQWHRLQSDRMHDPILVHVEAAKAQMAMVMLNRLQAYERGEEPITAAPTEGE